jgi:hypothetical protein
MTMIPGGGAIVFSSSPLCRARGLCFFFPSFVFALFMLSLKQIFLFPFQFSFTHLFVLLLFSFLILPSMFCPLCSIPLLYFFFFLSALSLSCLSLSVSLFSSSSAPLSSSSLPYSFFFPVDPPPFLPSVRAVFIGAEGI